MWLPILASLVDSRFHAIPQNIPLELRKHGQHTGQRPPAWGREVEGFAQGDEADLKGGQLLQRVNQVRQRPPPAIRLIKDALPFLQKALFEGVISNSPATGQF